MTDNARDARALGDLDAIEYRFDRFAAPLHLWGPAGLIAELASRQRVDTPERRERYLRRLEAVPAYLDEMGKVARDGMRVGQTVPEVVVDRTIAQTDRLVATDPADSPAIAPLRDVGQEEFDRFLGVISDW